MGDMKQVGKVWSVHHGRPGTQLGRPGYLGSEHYYAQPWGFCDEWYWDWPCDGSWKRWIFYPLEPNWKSEVVRLGDPFRGYIRCLN